MADLAKARASEYSIVSNFKYGYRHREDITNLPPGVLIVGSKNVLTNVSDRVQIRQGYSVDGDVSSVAGPVLASFDFLTKGNGERNLRAGGLTSAGNDGKLQFRYEDSDGAVSWIDLLSGLTTVSYNFAAWWNTVEQVREALFVNGTSNIFSWNGAVSTIAAVDNATGHIAAATLHAPVGYAVGDVLTVSGGTTSAVIKVVSIAKNSGAATVVPHGGSSGTGYAVNDTVTINGGTPGYLALLKVTSVSGGAVTGLSVISAGLGYSGGGPVATTTVTGTGSGLTVSISSTGDAISGWNFTNIGAGYSVANGLTTTGGSSTGATLDVTAVATGQIKLTGTGTALGQGFYSASNKNVVINGTTYAYTNLSGLSLVGITPSAAGEAVGSVVAQAVVTTPNANMKGIDLSFGEGLISVMNNQVFLGSLTSSVMWLSKVNSYTDYTQSTTRQVGEGGSLVLDQNLVAFNVQGAQDTPTMYVSAGTDIWYRITFETLTSVVGASGETLGAVPIKTGRRQGAQSQALVSSMKNSTIAVSFEPTIDTLGVVEDYLTQIQTTNISDPIKLDVDQYDYTDGSIFYFRYNIYVAIPKAGVVIVYNLATSSWEAPQTLPISRFYIVDGELYGHSYNSFESYKLFTGYADRVYTGFTGYPIAASWVFSYQNYGSRFSYKKATKLYVEGYINANTTLLAGLTYELDGCKTVKTFEIDGSNGQYVCLVQAPGSIGKDALGKEKLGGAGSTSIDNLPPKFRIFPTFTNTDFFEASISFSVLGVNNRAEILAFGLAVTESTQIPVQNMV